jgi:acylphosphatase
VDSGTSAFKAVVRGRVQGVGFREYVDTRARSLGLRGYVRNLQDGNLEVLAEGPAAALERMLAYLHQGPRGSRVTAVDVEWREPQNAFADFRVAF